ncbi:sensor histidine kinase [Pontiella sp.]|uniref:sensor histidine kinase n=1 Tax=Pontiella sp. TaxID=2837462 RepID=UPI003566D12D
MRLIPNRVLYLPLLAACTAFGAQAEQGKSLHSINLEALEQRRATIDSELDELAEITLRSGVGNLGWQSKPGKQAHRTEWAEINFGSDQSIDQIVLVPLLWRDTKRGVQADGFPVEFRIVAGSTGDRQGSVIAAYTEKDNLLPRIAPLTIPIEPTTAAWIRVEAAKLTPQALDGQYALSLSEILVFSGEENIALHRPVKVSSSARTIVNTKDPTKALVDGFTPYVLNAAQGEKSPDFVCFFKMSDQFSLSLDLGEPLPLNRIHLHAADREETVPHLQHADYALPKHMIVEGANQADFSDAVILTEYKRANIYDACTIIPLQFPETTCRYVRLLFPEAYKAPEAKELHRCIGFTEIELFSRSRNAAFGKRFHAIRNGTDYGDGFFRGIPDALTDGRNHFGSILPMKQWLNELALRHDLETQRPIVVQELNTRYARQKRNLSIMYLTTGILVGVAILAFIIERTLHRRHMAEARQRFTANLHDELGANLHTIGLLGDTARAVKNDPEKLDHMLERIRALTERSGNAARHCANLIEAEGLFDDVAEEMHQISSRVMNDLDHTITIEGEAALKQLSPRRRVDLLLFYKEALINTIRHSGATKVGTELTADQKEFTLSITDNGHGLRGDAPSSLKRRARLLGAKVTAESLEEGGTQITLHLRPPRRLRLRQPSQPST